MKVALVHAVPSGGAARRIGGFVRGWMSRDDVELQEFCVGSQPLDFTGNARRLTWSSRADRATSWRKPVLRYVDHFENRQAWRRLWSAVDAWGPDVVFANPAGIPGGAPPAAERCGRPLVLYADEPRRADYEGRAKRSTRALTRVPYYPLRRLQRRQDRAAVRAATAVATNSQYSAGRIARSYGVSAAVVSPGVGETFVPAQQRAQTRDGYVLSVGTLIPSKGHDIVIRAVARAKEDIRVVVVSPRPNGTFESTLALVAGDHGVGLDVRVAITDAEMLDLYRGALATMYLSSLEPLGLASLESQACGTPVIVADEGGLPETLRPHGFGLAVARDPSEAAAALAMVLDREWVDARRAAAVGGVLRSHDASLTMLDMLRSVSARS